MRDVSRKWTQREKYFKYQNFPTHFRLSLLLECFGEILTTIGQIFIHNKISQTGCIPLKIKCEILAHKGSQLNNSRHAKKLSRLLKLPTDVTTEPPGINTMNQRSPGKSNPLQTWSVERWGGHHNNEQSCQRQRKISQRSWKIGNCAKEQDNESTDSFPNSRRLMDS